MSGGDRTTTAEPEAERPAPRSGDFLDRLDHGLARLEGGLLIAILATMIGLSALQLVLRKSMDFGFEWADVLVRQMVLWLGFVGGARATYEGRHIAVDAVRRLLSPRQRAAVGVVTAGIAAILTAVMTSAAVTFVRDERAADTPAGIGSVPAWVLAAVIPVSLALITFHFVVAGRHLFLVALGRRAAETPSHPEGAS